VNHTLESKVVRAWERDFENHIFTDDKNIYTQQAHNVSISPESKLGKIYKESNPNVDLSKVSELSTHHQGCFKENLSDKLKITAISEDGVIEAVELIDYPNLFLATQYHFEYNVGNIADKIFKELIFDI
jgi:gamma-glutamyl-gamma-aminobutyrate hydrolase PuuD